MHHIIQRLKVGAERIDCLAAERSPASGRFAEVSMSLAPPPVRIASILSGVDGGTVTRVWIVVLPVSPAFQAYEDPWSKAW